MTIHKLPTDLTAEDEALQELKKSPMWPPEPPATCYVVLEFPCIVSGAADTESAYMNAVAQLRELLATKPDTLVMNYLAKDDYDHRYEDEDDDDEYTEEELHPLFGRRFQWPMHPNNLPESPAALMAAVAAQEQDIHNYDPTSLPYDVTRLAVLSGLSVLDVRFRHNFRGKKKVKRIGDGTHDMSYAEILWLLHQSVSKDDLGDHVFFESLTPVASAGSVPLYDVFMGS